MRSDCEENTDSSTPVLLKVVILSHFIYFEAGEGCLRFS